MGISVTCPNGHELKVKSKYAGKKGLCPKCPGKVVIDIPAEAPVGDVYDEFVRNVFGDKLPGSSNNKSPSGNFPYAPSARKSGEIPNPLEDDSTLTGTGSGLRALESGSFASLSALSTSGSSSEAGKDTGGSQSLFGTSVIRHETFCECGTNVPLWFARCPKCGQFMHH